MARKKITSSERTLLTMVSSAVFSNPFGGDWSKARAQLLEAVTEASYEQKKQVLIGAVAVVAENLAKEGKGNIRDFEGPDRRIIESCFLFDVYLKFYDAFDGLIDSQVEAGDTSCRVSFAQDALAMLTAHGFDPEEALHYFSLFFQMRRAYYFISRNISGQSPCMAKLKEELWNNIFSSDIRLYSQHLRGRMEDFSTLLLGETGTGKGVAALAIGRAGYIPFDMDKGCFRESFTHAFVSLNLSQFPLQIIESELFGHKKGAFTGAVSEHKGVFSRCSPYGAIFLDEIGEVSVPIQIKLLHVLQDRSFTPVGSHEKKEFRGRVIAATNRSVRELRQGPFRDDFYYRLCSDVITVPPLRQRLKEDPAELGLLINRVLSRITGGPSPELEEKITDLVLAQLPQDYHWPGNVREFEQCIRRLLLKRTYEVTPVDEQQEDKTEQDAYIRGVRQGAVTANELLSGYCKLLYGMYGSYEAVARVAGLDRRTARKYVEA